MSNLRYQRIAVTVVYDADEHTDPATWDWTAYAPYGATVVADHEPSAEFPAYDENNRCLVCGEHLANPHSEGCPAADLDLDYDDEDDDEPV